MKCSQDTIQSAFQSFFERSYHSNFFFRDLLTFRQAQKGPSCLDEFFNLHRVLGSCEFQWCGFHLWAFSKNSLNIQLMLFSLHKSLLHLLRIWFMRIFARPKKMHEPRTECILFYGNAPTKIISTHCASLFLGVDNLVWLPVAK